MPIVINDTLISNQADNLRAAMSTDPKMRKVIQQHIREALFEARREVMANSPLEHDPRGAIRAVRTTVYERILGGNINILNGKKAHGISSYEAPRKVYPGMKGYRGGNRRTRSDRTKQIQFYPGIDRGFILRFVNSGTKTRVIGFRNNKSHKKLYVPLVTRIHAGDTARTGNRGAIAPRNWFENVAEKSLGMAADTIAEMIAIEAAAIANGEK